MSDFDPDRGLIMAAFRTVNGHGLTAGTPLVIVAEPSDKRAEIVEAMARRLHKSGVAVYADDFRPTPVETPEQEKAREAAGLLADAALPVIEGDGSDLTEEQAPELTAPADLVTWQADDADLGKKAGDRVTKEDLITIAFREEIELTDESTKPVIIRQIVEARAAKAV